MKHTENISLSITGLMVKAYMAVSIAWSKADVFYNNLTKNAGASNHMTSFQFPLHNLLFRLSK